MADVDYSVFEGKLIHPLEAFQPDEIEARADALGHRTARARIETFAWLLEVSAQLAEELGPQLTLRGGTNVQLRLDDARQRASQDIDALFHGTEEEIERAIQNLNARFAECDGFLQFTRVPRAFPPKNFAAWECTVPGMCGGRIYDDLPRRQLEIEFTLATQALPAEPAEGSVFGLRFQGEAQVLTSGALIGDKLLVLGPNTTGITNDQLHAVDRRARQFYDIDHLTGDGRSIGGTGLSIDQLSDAVEAVSYFAPIEASYRGKTADPVEALEDALNSAMNWARTGFSDGPSRELMTAVLGWQGIAVMPTEQLRSPAWGERFLRVALVARQVLEAIQLGSASAEAADAERRRLVGLLAQQPEAVIEALVNNLGDRQFRSLLGGSPARPALFAVHQLPNDELNALLSELASVTSAGE